MTHRGASRKRTNTSPPKATDFDAQFADFSPYSKTPPVNKRQRTGTGGRQFTFKTGVSRPQSDRIIPAGGFKPPSPKPRYVVPGPSEGEEKKENDLELDWGEDDAALLCAISQVEEEGNKQEEKVSEEDLQAMTLLLQDDDEFEDILKLPPKPPGPEIERLNQKMAVFSKKTPEPETPSAGPTNSMTGRSSPSQDLAKARRLQHKAQGEASWLRKEMEKREREFNKERNKFKDEELEWKEKLKEAKKKTADMEKRAESRIYFHEEEKRELKERLEKLEKDTKKVKELKNLSDARKVIAEDRKVKVGDNVSNIKKLEGPDQSLDHSVVTAPVPVRSRLVLPAVNREQMSAQMFSRISKTASADLKVSLLLAATNTAGLTATLRDNLQRQTEAISSELPALSSRLDTCLSLVECFGFLLSRHVRAQVTECCSLVLSSMVRTGDCAALQTVLSIIEVVWGPRLLSQDISGDIITRLAEVVEKVEPGLLDSKLAQSIYGVMCLVTVDPNHCPVLCRGGENCPLRLLPLLTRLSLAEGALPGAASAVCAGLVDWVSLSLSLPDRPPWTNNCCSQCTSAVVRWVNCQL